MKGEVSKLKAVKNILLMELKIISVPLFMIYALDLVINLFTYDGHCANLIFEPGRPSCSYSYAVFAEPFLAILIFAVIFSWIWIPLFVIITVVLTAVSLRKSN